MGQSIEERRAQIMLSKQYIDDMMVETCNGRVLQIHGSKTLTLKPGCDVTQIHNNYVRKMLTQGWVEIENEVHIPQYDAVACLSGVVYDVPTTESVTLKMTFLRDPERATQKLQREHNYSDEMFFDEKQYDAQNNTWNQLAGEGVLVSGDVPLGTDIAISREALDNMVAPCLNDYGQGLWA